MRRAALSITATLSLFLAAVGPACSSDPEQKPQATATPTDDASAAGEGSTSAEAGPPAPDCDPYAARTFPAEAIIGPTGLEASIIQTINGAKTSVDLMVFELSHKPLAQALDAARKRGVALRMIVDRAQIQDLKATFGEALRESPASLPRFGATVLVADGSRALVTSADFTQNAMTKQRSYGAYLQDADDIAGLKSLFEQDWKGEGGAAAICKRLVVTPGAAHDLITDHIEGAEGRLDLEVRTIADPRVLEAIKGRAGNGFPVRIMLAGSEVVAGNETLGDSLKAAGAEVRYFRNPDVFSKLVVTESGALVGSHDLVTDALTKDRSVSVVVDSDDAIKKITTQFESDWSTSALR